MKKWLIVALVLLVIPVVYGCGSKSVSGGGASGVIIPPGVSSSGSRVAGTAVVAESELARLGLSGASSTSSLNANPLVSKSIVHAMALTSGEVDVCTMDAFGQFIPTGISTSLASDGSFALYVSPESDATQYFIRITKSNGGKILVMYCPIYISGEVSGDTSVLTTMIAEIISVIVEQMESNGVDPKVIEQVKTYLLTSLNEMVANGEIKLPSLVYDSSQATNNDLKNVVLTLLESSGASKDVIDGIKFNLQTKKAIKNLDDAKQFIRDIFIFMTGSPTGMPQEGIDAFAQAYFDGKTFTIAEVVDAINKSGIDSNGNSITLTINPDDIASGMNTNLSDLYSNLGKGTGSVPPIILAVFPPDEKNALLPVTRNTRLKVSQVMLVVQKVMDEMRKSFDPFKMTNTLGIYTMSSGPKIMHAEVRAVTYHDWEHNTDTPVINSYVDVYDPTGITALSNAKVSLIYPLETGLFSIEAMVESTRTGGGGGGFSKGYYIDCYSQNANRITNFKKSESGVNCTVAVIVPGSPTIEATVKLYYFESLMNPKISLLVPKETMEYGDVTELAYGTSPVFSWSQTQEVSLPAGYTLKYAVEIQKAPTNPSAPPTQVFNSWDKQKFISGTSFTLPSDIILEKNTQYFIGVRAVAVNDAMGRPVAEGPYANGMFVIKDPSDIAASASFTLSGKITKPSSDSNVKVGLFKVNYAAFSSGAKVEPIKYGAIAADDTFTVVWEPTSLSDLKGSQIEVIAWNDSDNDSKALVGMSGEPCAFAKKHIGYWGGALSVYNENTGNSSPLKDSQTDFDCDLTFGGMR